MSDTLSVGELLIGVETAVVSAFPGEVWVRGEISGFRRTNRGAGFFKLVDPDDVGRSVDVAARGRVMADIDRALVAANVGRLRSGIEVRVQGTVGLRQGGSAIQLNLLGVDPEFIAGRLAVDREEVLRRLQSEGLLESNRALAIPIVPLRVGLVTSRGSAAHADFLDHLKRPGYRFRVSTVESAMQGMGAPEQIFAGLRRLADQPVDIVALIRGGGSKLDLSAFDDEAVGRQVASMPVPVLTGIGHETDRSIADEVAAVAEKTPTAAAEWLVSRVAEYDRRIETARSAIADQAVKSIERTTASLNHLVAQFSGSREILRRQEDGLAHHAVGIEEEARRALTRQSDLIGSYQELVSTLGIESTLRRGFAVVTRPDGSAVRSAAALHPGESVTVRFADGEVGMKVSEPDV